MFHSRHKRGVYSQGRGSAPERVRRHQYLRVKGLQPDAGQSPGPNFSYFAGLWKGLLDPEIGCLEGRFGTQKGLAAWKGAFGTQKGLAT